jgi:endoglucanase
MEYAGRVEFTNGTRGMIGMEPAANATTVQPLDRMYIDVGATSRENCPVSVGDFGIFSQPFLDLGDRLVSKAMDDRAGAAVLVEVIRQLGETPHECWFVFSVQEEVGLRGARTSAYRIDPDLGIALDVTLTGDTPKARPVMAIELGKGPAIKVKDSGMIASPKVVKLMADVASEHGIPYQLEVLTGGTTDAAAMQLTKSGVAAGCVSIPCRYVHSPSEMIDINDLQNAVRLILRIIEKPINF